MGLDHPELLNSCTRSRSVEWVNCEHMETITQPRRSAPPPAKVIASERHAPAFAVRGDK